MTGGWFMSPDTALKVAYVTMAFPAPSETFACNDVRALQREGVEVSVHSLRPGGAGWRMLAAERDVTDVPITQNSAGNSIRGMFYALGRPLLLLRVLAWLLRRTTSRPAHLGRSLLLLPRAFDILRRLRRERPDVVHLFWGHYPAIVGYLVRQDMRSSVRSMFLGAYDLTWGYGGTATEARAADAVWTHADHNIAAIERLGVTRSRIHRVYRGIDFRLFPSATEKIPFRIVTAGRFLPQKGMDTVLHAFREILQKWPAATLVVLGDGAERKTLEELAASLEIQHAVRFAGRVSQVAVIAEMSSAEVFLFLSRKSSERLPNVVKEAIATGCVIVVSDTDGISELVSDGESGFIVPQSDASAAAERVDRTFSNPERIPALTAAARKHLREHFDVVTSMRIYKNTWNALVAARREPTSDRGPHAAPAPDFASELDRAAIATSHGSATTASRRPPGRE
jgi:colanic acid/amylovoran biosynthesis glycosyltransferase